MGKFYEGLADQLILFVRHIAWLNTGPVKQTKKGQERLPARRDQLKADRVESEEPPCDAPHLIEYLFDAGPVEVSGGQPAALSSTELEHWQAGSGIPLAPWEFRLLRRLSREYLAQCIASEDPSEPAPYITKEGIERNRKAANRKASMELKALAMAQRNKA